MKDMNMWTEFWFPWSYNGCYDVGMEREDDLTVWESDGLRHYRLCDVGQITFSLDASRAWLRYYRSL